MMPVILSKVTVIFRLSLSHILFYIVLCTLFFSANAFSANTALQKDNSVASDTAMTIKLNVDALRQQYSQPQSSWPSVITADNEKAEPLAPLTPKAPLGSATLIKLGKTLFHDPILSSDKTISCASCHNANTLFQDGRGQSIGVDEQKGERNAPAILGIDHWESFFWDGRASTASQQALMPIVNPIEMNLPIPEALKRLNNSRAYQAKFNEAFGTLPITADMLATALVEFERSIPAPSTRYQRFIREVASDPTNAHTLFTDNELLGLHLFRTKAKCMTCHEGALLSDNEFHVTGFHLYGRRFEDLGRVNATSNNEDIGKFRTPSLLGVTHTKPWMHNGLFVEFTPMIMQYNAGGFRPKPRGKFKHNPHFPETTALIQPLGLTKSEISALVDFLHTL
ncbi:cytochrome-c peroxidase [Alteromonas hispanica]|nr:cytochrome c peroxidase [Alteromonas hispanica]